MYRLKTRDARFVSAMFILRILTVAVTLGSAAPVAASQVLFVNQPLLTNDLGFFSDVRWPEWQADDFVLTGGPAFYVRQVAWWGRYFLQGQAGAVTPDGSDDFVLRLYGFQGGNPYALHFLEVPLGFVPRQLVTTSANGVPIFRWEAALPDPILLDSATPYAFSLFNRGGAAGDPVFALLWSTPANWGDPRWRRTSETAPWQKSGYNLAFQFVGEVIPEPTGLLVLAAGLPVLARICRVRD